MTIDKSHAWYTNIDIEIHCVCDKYIQVSTADNGIITCDRCGQQYDYKLHIKIRGKTFRQRFDEIVEWMYDSL